MAVFIGVVVLLVCIGFVVLMMVTEWSSAPGVQAPADRAAALPAKRSAARKPAPKKKSAPKKKKK